MQIKYTTQPHQTKAIESIVELFRGQSRQVSEYDIFDGEAVCGNRYILDDMAILDNLHSIQKRNGIEASLVLESRDFSVEMETGTGKTYVYIKSILELYAEYGWNKYIIITPSIAIREGVLSSLESMKKHFADSYKFPYDYFEYDSSRLGSLKHFIRDDGLQIMVMTIDSFKRANTILNMTQEGFAGTPKQSLRKTNPILILDEPQNMESELSKTSISELNPLFTLRFSATHKNYYNLLYTLTPKEALAQGLVKQIDVLALSENQTVNDIYIHVKKIEIDKRSKRPVATLELIVKNRDEFVTKSVKIKGNDSLKDKTKNPIYTGFIVDEINAREMFLQFENGLRLELSQINGEVKRQIQKQQISEAIALHMQKFEQLKKRNVKVLSLFFVDRVANFLTQEEGWMQGHFCKEFNRLKVDYESFRDVKDDEVYRYYFAKRKSGYIDDLKNSDSDRRLAKKTYDLIMKEKENLLSFEEKTSFIFSHSALREGWDNPNVFFITTLNDTKSEMKKRQILGRGVRLAVDVHGNRVEERELNRLTVIANESFDEFAKSLQQEYEVSGVSEGQIPNNLKKKIVAKRQYDESSLSKEFKELWDKLKKRTIFELKLDEEKYIEKVIGKLQNIETTEQKIVKQLGTIENDVYGYVAEEKSYTLNFKQTLPDLVSLIEREIGVTRRMIIEILNRVDLTPFIRNSDAYIRKALEAFEDAKHEILTESSDGIVYRESGEYYAFTNLFPEMLEGYDLQACKRGLYDTEQWDSNIEKEFIKCADTHFKFFAKLPKRFKIKTPLGNYSPDFAVIKFDESEGSFIVETKGSEKESELRAHEKWQIAYAKKHFKLMDIQYRERITKCSDI
ncbi:MAG: DEAD/DEAH box helicase family protein [Campylobacterota bacterium]|nr:DEAD/DEAH box helicase family protein [Campylobacterota bacterium]